MEIVVPVSNHLAPSLGDQFFSLAFAICNESEPSETVKR